MRWSTGFDRAGIGLGVVSLLLLPSLGVAQETHEKTAETSQAKVVSSVEGTAEIQAINDKYEEQRLQLERQRLESLSRLAARQSPNQAAVTYEQLFRLAIANNLFMDASQTAEQVIQKGSPSTATFGLANLVKIIAEVDRGESEKSLESLRQVIEAAGKGSAGDASKPTILTSEKIELCDLYYQRLIHANQLQVARKAFQLLKDRVQNPAIAAFVTGRLKRLELVGKPAPAIRGTDVDGKPFDLAAKQGKVVLLVFWTSWCLPCADEVEGIRQVADAYHAKGFEVVGINLDALEEDGQKSDDVEPNVRRFLLDYNISWPNLIDKKGHSSYANAYGVTAIPSNTLVGRDGTIIQLDLVQKNLESVVAQATAR
jgi:peroxiredoxin